MPDLSSTKIQPTHFLFFSQELLVVAAAVVVVTQLIDAHFRELEAGTKVM